MSNQLLKKSTKGYENIFPKTYLDAIKDRTTGVSLQDIINNFNMLFLSYTGDAQTTRLSIIPSLRKEGLWITYVDYDSNVITEWYNGKSITDEEWQKASNWRKGSNSLVGDISITSDGYWVINGQATEAKAQGEQGITPLLRFSENHKLEVSYNEGKTYSTLGNITNYLRIQKYIGANESLPTKDVAEGTIYMKGPIYDENDANNDYPIYRMWVYAYKDNTLAWQDSGEFQSIPAGITQETGNNENVVMSQKATTDALNAVLDNVSDNFKVLNPMTVSASGINQIYEEGVDTTININIKAIHLGQEIPFENLHIILNDTEEVLNNPYSTTINSTTDFKFSVEYPYWYPLIDVDNYKQLLYAETVNTKATFVKPCYFGWNTQSVITESLMKGFTKYLKTSPSGSYSINGTTDKGYVWLCVPSTMSINKVTMGGFEFPVEEVATSISGYKCYRSNELVRKNYNIIIS